MNAQSIDLPPAIGAALGGGFYAGRILIAEKLYALIVAPKAEGERKPGPWSKSYASVPGASSWNDGLANTAAMVAAGSELGEWAQGLRIGGYSDWYLGAPDEAEITYRYLKPTTEPNFLWNRSGINVSAVPPTYPYTADLPAQTTVDLFRAGGSEAFEEAPYWTSAQHASLSYAAWGQGFSNGYQHTWGKGNHVRARAVRRLAL
jgi:hypothetical protein